MSVLKKAFSKQTGSWLSGNSLAGQCKTIVHRPQSMGCAITSFGLTWFLLQLVINSSSTKVVVVRRETKICFAHYGSASQSVSHDPLMGCEPKHNGLRSGPS